MSTNDTDNSVSVSRVIAADAQALFDVVADPTLHHVIDGSGSVQGVRGGSRKLALGDKFSASMRIGVPYLITNKVVEYTEGRRIAWAHVGGWRWRYEFEPVEDGTSVTETFDWSTSRAGAYIRLMKWAPKNRANMERTLARLDAFATNTSSSL
ncbi:MAG: SRPBCC family protein [Microthrixaceae bacterium]